MSPSIVSVLKPAGLEKSKGLITAYYGKDPTDPRWPDRDRFVLSCGHASMLLYSMLHLSGYDLPLSEIENFRQWGSKTPGHPELERFPNGVETTTMLGFAARIACT